MLIDSDFIPVLVQRHQPATFFKKDVRCDALQVLKERIFISPADLVFSWVEDQDKVV